MLLMSTYQARGSICTPSAFCVLNEQNADKWGNCASCIDREVATHGKNELCSEIGWGLQV